MSVRNPRKDPIGAEKGLSALLVHHSDHFFHAHLKLKFVLDSQDMSMSSIASLGIPLEGVGNPLAVTTELGTRLTWPDWSE